MTDKRQVYRVILQIMTYIGIAILLWVMFSSVFVEDEENSDASGETIEVLVKSLAKGESTHVIWQGKKVSILHRNTPKGVANKTNEYFVYYDLGDSGNCPLFFTGDILKDTCTGTTYNQFGKPIERTNVNDLESPPHYFIEPTKLLIGEDKEE